MKLTIYGIARSRAIRNLWMAEELGLAYQHVQTVYGPEGSRKPDFLKLNPNGRVPAADVDGVILWESLAINLHLAKKVGGSLSPKDVDEDGLMTMWSMWAVTEVETPALAVLTHGSLKSEAERDNALLAKSIEALKAPLAVLEAHLAAHSGHLVGGRFTVADLNVAACVFYLRLSNLLADKPAITAWYTGAMERPAAKKAFALRGD
ncbi:glutathione S-transferase family protein [Phreatobacter aquaticus]|uniref:Glutathione S-transferase family protein n=1 Tax=Phreatobacter aquaticus TaxID=2570229 RepID=A0A4D7QCN4_9HYPH|nr:glutathione S-transferase family protein [Phreatobacter aquaticus]QCK85770.1 glutathione S-transferase family protein [Phreatobacter aquaticus]